MGLTRNITKGITRGITRELIDPFDLQIGSSRCNFDFSETNTITASGNDVISVTDLFGTGITLSQSSSSNRPKTGLMTQNGLNVVKFTATNTEFLNLSSNSVFNSAFTIFIVAQSNSTDAVQAFLGRQISNDLGSFVSRREANGFVFNSFLYGTGGSSQIAKASNNNANIHTLSFVNGGGLTYSLNNGASTSGAARSGYADDPVILAAIGASNGLGGNPLDGWIGQVIIYGAVLTTSQISAINRYLSKKWGIAI